MKPRRSDAENTAMRHLTENEVVQFYSAYRAMEGPPPQSEMKLTGSVSKSRSSADGRTKWRAATTGQRCSMPSSAIFYSLCWLRSISDSFSTFSTSRYHDECAWASGGMLENAAIEKDLAVKWCSWFS